MFIGLLGGARLCRRLFCMIGEGKVGVKCDIQDFWSLVQTENFSSEGDLRVEAALVSVRREERH